VCSSDLMTKRSQPVVATLAVAGALAFSAGAGAVTPGQTTDQAASSTGAQGGSPAVTEVGKGTGCSTAGGAEPKSGAWSNEQNKASPGSGQASAAGCPATDGQQQTK